MELIDQISYEFSWLLNIFVNMKLSKILIDLNICCLLLTSFNCMYACPLQTVSFERLICNYCYNYGYLLELLSYYIKVWFISVRIGNHIWNSLKVPCMYTIYRATIMKLFVKTMPMGLKIFTKSVICICCIMIWRIV